MPFLNALASSGHVLCSPEMVSTSGIQKGFHLVNSAEDILAVLPGLMETKLMEEDWGKRVTLVEENFGDKALLGWLKSGGI